MKETLEHPTPQNHSLFEKQGFLIPTLPKDRKRCYYKVEVKRSQKLTQLLAVFGIYDNID